MQFAENQESVRWRKYKIQTKGIEVVIEELNQRISARAHKIKQYNDRILQFQQNQLFEVNQRQFYNELDDPRGRVTFGTGQCNPEEMLVG